MGIKKGIIGSIILVLLLSMFGCVIQTSSTDKYLSIIEKSKDYQDFKADFKIASGREYAPVLYYEKKLDQPFIDQMLASNDSSVIRAVYVNLTATPNMYEVRYQDNISTSRAIIAVVDMDAQNITKFFALIKLEVKG